MSEPDVSDLLTVDRAIEIIDSTPVTPKSDRTDMTGTRGCRLAEDVRSDRDYPPFDKSLMDGFAVRIGDITSPLRVVGEIAAGASADRALGVGEAIAVMTGAPIPSNTEAIVPVEYTQRVGDSITILKSVKEGQAIARRGSDCRAGEIVLKAGTRLNAAQLAVAASVGATEVSIFLPPRVAVLSTGDEIVPIEAAPGPSQIRNSNALMLESMLRHSFGCFVDSVATAPDKPELIRREIDAALESCTVLFVSGGMSMGEYDFVPRVLDEMGFDLKITKLRIKPGKPFVFATKGVGDATRYVFGLPGNPVSSFVCTLRLASRLLVRLSGGTSEERVITAKIEDALPANGPREFYQPGIWNGESIRPLQWKGSADIYTLARANVLIVRPENEASLPPGSIVRAMEIPS
ncbi:MAG TPA: gephyrin-like molybdotransferase Glp [Tepidisphaeraceae bacterium]|nr:gephyrin-like molybdotransferase Glp [Tepidisphaeraceae bacterium]